MTGGGFDHGKRFSEYEYEKRFSPTTNKRDIHTAWGPMCKLTGKKIFSVFHFTSTIFRFWMLNTLYRSKTLSSAWCIFIILQMLTDRSNRSILRFFFLYSNRPTYLLNRHWKYATLHNRFNITWNVYTIVMYFINPWVTNGRHNRENQ